MDRLQVLLVDPNQLFREGLKRLLDEKYVVAGEAKYLEEVLPQIRAGHRADLLVFDVDVPESKDPAAAIGAIRAALPEVRIVVLTNNATRAMVGRAIGWGVDGYLLKDMSLEALTRSLELVMLGQQVLPAQITVALLATRAQRPAADEAAAPSCSLSRREHQILCHLLDGASNKLIARELKITEATVKTHLNGLLRKLQATNRTQAVIWALNNGFAEERARTDGA